MADKYQQKSWWLIRHAPVLSGKLYGHSDLPADFSNSARLEALSRMIPQSGHFYSSDLQRCVQTAERISALMEIKEPLITKVKALREQNFGRWEGCGYEEIEVSYPDEYRAFWKDPAINYPPGGESFADLAARVAEQMNDMLMTDNDEIVMIVHAGTIRAVLGAALGMAPERMLSFVIDPLSLTRLRSFTLNGKASWEVRVVNSLADDLRQ